MTLREHRLRRAVLRATSWCASAKRSATALRDGSVLIVGGGSCDCPSKTVWRTAEVYDPSAGKFTPGGSLSEARYKHAAVPLADGKVLVAGGSDARAWRGLLSNAELYDPSSRSFGGLPPPSVFRAATCSSPVALSSPKYSGQRSASLSTWLRASRRLAILPPPPYSTTGVSSSWAATQEANGLPAASRAWLYHP